MLRTVNKEVLVVRTSKEKKYDEIDNKIVILKKDKSNFFSVGNVHREVLDINTLYVDRKQIRYSFDKDTNELIDLLLEVNSREYENEIVRLNAELSKSKESLFNKIVNGIKLWLTI